MCFVNWMFCLSVNAWFEVEKLEKVCVQEWKVGRSTIESKPTQPLPKNTKIHPCSLTAGGSLPPARRHLKNWPLEALQKHTAWRLPSAHLAPHQKNWCSGILLIRRLAASDIPPGGSAVRAMLGPFKICSDLAQTLTPYYSRLAPCSHSSPRS